MLHNFVLKKIKQKEEKGISVLATDFQTLGRTLFYKHSFTIAF